MTPDATVAPSSDLADPESSAGPEPGVYRPRVLVADDDAVVRLVLVELLTSFGCEVIEAENGLEAVESFCSERPDIVFLDVIMPRLTGDRAAALIKEEAGEEFVPVLFLTSIEDTDRLAGLLDAGGDDFLVKPVNAVVLRAKLDVLRRNIELHRVVADQRNRLLEHRNHEIREREMAREIMHRVTRVSELDAPNIRRHVAPAALLNGDLVLAARTPSGGQRLFLGDFTGHGLPASIGAMPTAELFYRYTDRGVGIVEMMRHLNRRLLEMLPTEVFLAALCLEVSMNDGVAVVCNAGMPDVLWMRDGQPVKRFRSSHPPLGVLRPTSIDEGVAKISVMEGDRFYAYTDGIAESRNEEGEEYGYARLEETLRGAAESAFDRVLQSRAAFTGRVEAQDDATLVEYLCTSSTGAHTPIVVENPAKSQQDWRCGFTYHASLLRAVDPLPALMQVLTDFNFPTEHRRAVSSIVRELFQNSVDHGLLGLDSSVKEFPDGFATFAKLRDERLLALKDGSVSIRLDHASTASGGRLGIRVRDTGPGFDGCCLDDQENAAAVPWGRGIQLVRALCESLEYSAGGTVAEAVFVW